MADFRLSEIDQQIIDKVIEVGNSTSAHTRYYEDHEHETPPARLEGERGFEEVFPLFGQRAPGDTPMMTMMMGISIARGSTNGVVRGLGLGMPQGKGERRQRLASTGGHGEGEHAGPELRLCPALSKHADAGLHHRVVAAAEACHLSGLGGQMGIEPPRIREGSLAELVLIDPEATLAVDRLPFKSKSRNTPFMKHELKGKIMLTLARGQVAFETEGGAS